MKAIFTVAVFIFSLLAQPAGASIQAQRLKTSPSAIHIDGKLDEAEWKSARAYDRFYQTQPFDRVAAHVKTEVRILYDERYLYVGIKGFDPDSSLIRDSFSRRDRISSDQDYFGLFIDPSGAHKAAQVFYVNARGAIMDGIYSDINGEDTAPDYEFDVAVARFDGGWSAEYRIPFSSIAYDKQSVQEWSILVMRNMTRDQRYRMYSGEVTRATNCNLCFSETIAGMTDLPSAVSWTATPQLTARRNTEKQTGFPTNASSVKDLSLDLKFRPDSSTTIDATINPDFSQIELDSPQLSGNTMFSIYSPEKRPFFLEGADMLRTPFNAISTRSIANPDVGLRYTRRDTDKDLGIISSRDASGGTVLIPHTYYTGSATSTTSSIATDARVNFRLGAMTAGAILTDRSYEGGRGYNRVAGPDMMWQVDQNSLFRAQVLMSSTTAQADDKGNLVRGATTEGHAAYVAWMQGDDFWGLSASVRDLSKDFRDDNGFFSQVGYRAVNSDLTKKFGRIGDIHELNIYVSGEYRLDMDGNILSKSIIPGIRISGPYDSSAYFNLIPSSKSRINQDGELFTLNRIGTGIGVSPSKAIARLAADLTYGDMIDVTGNRLGRGGQFSFGAKLRPIDRLEIEPSYANSWIDSTAEASSGVRAYTESALQVNGIFHLTSQDTIRMILQDGKISRNSSLYAFAVTPESNRSVQSFVFTHRTGVGNASYFGWTTTKNDASGIAPKRQQNELFVKLSWQI